MPRPLKTPVLLAILAIATLTIVGGPATAADPDRYVFESDRFDEEFGIELEMRLEEALEGLESLDGLEESLAGLDDLGDRISVIVEEALRDGSVHVDRDWPDRVWIRGDDLDMEFDTREFARDMERMARQIERSVTRSLEVRRFGEHHGRAWRPSDPARDRREIESEMRDLEREMRRLQRELDELEAEGDI